MGIEVINLKIYPNTHLLFSVGQKKTEITTELQHFFKEMNHGAKTEENWASEY